MNNKVYLSHSDIEDLCYKLAHNVANFCNTKQKGEIQCFPIPRGGIPVVYLLKSSLQDLIGLNVVICEKEADADVFIDDIIDSGETMRQYCDKFPGIPFFALIDKIAHEYSDSWVVFPWEGTQESSIENNVTRILQYIGEDPERQGLLETPERYAKALQHWFSGYNKDPAKILKVFEDGAEKHDQMITVKDIPIYSFCEHHIAPIFGTVTISYIPNGKIVGLSKLSRLADIFARRLQVQERLTDQIADALFEHLQPLGVGVLIKARHMCMESRGVCQQGHYTITTALRGVIKSENNARTEFLRTAE